MGMVVAQALALIFLALFALTAPVEQPARPGLSPELREAMEHGFRIGWAIGTFITPLLLSALILGWSRTTRPFIPFLALVFVGLSAFGS